MNEKINLRKYTEIFKDDDNCLSSRLNFCLRYRGISQTKLAKAIGVTPQNIQALCAGKIQKSRHLNEIAIFLNVNPTWLVTGHSTHSNQYPTQITEVFQIALISWQEIDMPAKSTAAYSISGIFDHADLSYALQVNDDSMCPKFERGDILLVSQSNKIVHGDYVIAKITSNNQCVFRIYHDETNLKLIAINPAYEDISNLETKFEIMGIVKETRTNLKNE